MKGHFGTIFLILLGAFLLLNNLGLIDVSFWQLFTTWWPVMLIILGVSLFYTPGDKKTKE